jgi:hypothetical protein
VKKEGRWLSQEGRIVSTPLLKLQPKASFTADGNAIRLATVVLLGGAVTSLSGADRQLARLVAVSSKPEIARATQIPQQRTWSSLWSAIIASPCH